MYRYLILIVGGFVSLGLLGCEVRQEAEPPIIETDDPDQPAIIEREREIERLPETRPGVDLDVDVDAPATRTPDVTIERQETEIEGTFDFEPGPDTN